MSSSCTKCTICMYIVHTVSVQGRNFAKIIGGAYYILTFLSCTATFCTNSSLNELVNTHLKKKIKYYPYFRNMGELSSVTYIL